MKNFILAVCLLLSLAHTGQAAIYVAKDAAEAVAAIQKATAGDVVQLAPGNYGPLIIRTDQYNRIQVGSQTIHGKTNVLQGEATLTSLDKNNPAVLSSIAVKGAPHWTFDSLAIQPKGDNNYRAVLIEADDVSLTNNVMGYQDYATWAVTDWRTRAVRMVFLAGKRARMTGNRLYAVHHGVIVKHGADGAEIVGNRIFGIGGDGIDVSADNATIDGNVLSDFYQIGTPPQANHDDCLQVWAGPNVNKSGTLHGLIVKNNRCFLHQDLSYVPPAGSNRPGLAIALQGYGGYDSATDGCLIENNWGIISAYHGVSFGRPSNCVYRNNIVLNYLGSAYKETWVRAANAKGVLVEGNIANKIDETFVGATFRNNKTTDLQYYDSLFVDWRRGDLRLVGSTTTPTPPPPPPPPPVVTSPPKPEKPTEPTKETEEPAQPDREATISEKLEKLQADIDLIKEHLGL